MFALNIYLHSKRDKLLNSSMLVTHLRGWPLVFSPKTYFCGNKFANAACEMAALWQAPPCHSKATHYIPLHFLWPNKRLYKYMLVVFFVSLTVVRTTKIAIMHRGNVVAFGTVTHAQYNIVQCRYNAVHFLKYPHNRHSVMCFQFDSFSGAVIAVLCAK